MARRNPSTIHPRPTALRLSDGRRGDIAPVPACSERPRLRSTSRSWESERTPKLRFPPADRSKTPLRPRRCCAANHNPPRTTRPCRCALPAWRRADTVATACCPRSRRRARGARLALEAWRTARWMFGGTGQSFLRSRRRGVPMLIGSVSSVVDICVAGIISANSWTDKRSPHETG